MTQEEITEGNKLIAMFMGCNEETVYGGMDNSQWQSFGFKDTHILDRWRDVPVCWEQRTPYNSDWSWLMPVVEKIEAIDNIDVCIFREATQIRTWDGSLEIFSMKTIEHDASSKISHVFRCVVRFIKWYNAQMESEIAP